MRHFLRGQVGPEPLASGVFARASTGTLVLGPCSPQRLSSADRAAVGGAADLAMIAGPAHAHFLIASCAAELTNILDHPYPGR
jgi:hypothetical protein